MTPGYEAREAILKALGTGQAEAAGALVAVFAPEDVIAARAVRLCLRLQRLYRCRHSWTIEEGGASSSGSGGTPWIINERRHPARDASWFGITEAIRQVEPMAEDARTALRRHWPHPQLELVDQVLF